MEAALAHLSPILSKAVEALRALREGGFSVDIALHIAIDERLAKPDRADEEHDILVRLYREAIGEEPIKPAISFTEAERAPIDPAAPVLANFRRLWPTTLKDNADQTTVAWNRLSAAERADAIAGIAPYLAARQAGELRHTPAGATYLNLRAWSGLT